MWAGEKKEKHKDEGDSEELRSQKKPLQPGGNGPLRARFSGHAFRESDPGLETDSPARQESECS